MALLLLLLNNLVNFFYQPLATLCVQNLKVLAQVIKHFVFVERIHRFLLAYAFGVHVLVNAKGDEVGDVFVRSAHSVSFIGQR